MEGKWAAEKFSLEGNLNNTTPFPKPKSVCNSTACTYWGGERVSEQVNAVRAKNSQEFCVLSSEFFLSDYATVYNSLLIVVELPNWDSLRGYPAS